MLLSLGHSTKSLGEFLDLLRGANIDVVCDIRRFPRSRRHPHFSKQRLEQLEEIEYVWLGEALGGFRDPDYETWMKTEVFKRGIETLEKLSSAHTVGFMCSEGLPSKCHRRFVAQALVSRGNEVSHLLPGGKVVPAELPPARLDL